MLCDSAGSVSTTPASQLQAPREVKIALVDEIRLVQILDAVTIETGWIEAARNRYILESRTSVESHGAVDPEDSLAGLVLPNVIFTLASGKEEPSARCQKPRCVDEVLAGSIVFRRQKFPLDGANGRINQLGKCLGQELWIEPCIGIDQ